mgnify:CR=1 FL=1
MNKIQHKDIQTIEEYKQYKKEKKTTSLVVNIEKHTTPTPPPKIMHPTKTREDAIISHVFVVLLITLPPF